MQAVGKNIFSLGVSRIISGVVLFFVYLKLVTYFGPEEFGKFSLVLAYYIIFLLLIDLGMSRHVIKSVSEDQSRARVYLTNFLVIQFLIAIGTVVFFLLVPRAFGYDHEIARAMMLAGVGLAIRSLSIPFASIIQAWQKIHILAAVNFLDSLLNALWLGLTIFLEQSVVFIFWLYVLLGLIDLGIYTYYGLRLARPGHHFDRSLFRSMVYFGMPFAAIAALEVLISKIDVVIQKIYLPFTQVGLYSSAYRFLDFLTFVPAVIAISLFPYFAAQKELSNNAEAKDTIERLNRYMAAAAIPLGIGGLMISEKIILTLFGPDYQGSIVVLRILIWASGLTFLYAVPDILVITKRTRQAIYILVLATAVNVAANFVFIPRYGIIASAWITVASYLIAGIGFVIFSRRLIRFRLFRFLPKPLLAGAAMAGFLGLAYDLHLYLLVPLAAGLYFAILIVLGFLRKEDFYFLKSLFLKKR